MSNVSDAVGRVYAQALLEVAQAQKSVGKVHEDLHALQGWLEGAPDFGGFFRAPQIDRFDKWKVLEKALRGKVCDPVLGLVRTLILRARGPVFDNVVRQFDRYRDEAEHRIRAEVTTAVALAPAARDALRERLAKASGKTVVLTERVDPAVLGGASVRIGDRRLDATLRRRLSILRERLESPDTETLLR